MSATSGVLLVDKAAGLTSHDVVARARRRLGTRRVGHAGTLDPSATGLLVVLVEEATKLAPFLTAADKAYVAGVTFGRATDTLDADGTTVATAPVPEPLVREIEAASRGEARDAWPRIAGALDAEKAREEQVPPAFSAIHVDGVRSHALARSGAAPELAPRKVRLFEARVVGAHAERTTLDVEVEVEKGYYVRSFARDLGSSLGLPAHLSSLRRLRSGAFQVEEAIPIEEASTARLISMETAIARAMPVLSVSPETERTFRHGKPVPRAPSDPEGHVAVLSAETGGLIAVAESEDGVFRVVRGFSGRVA
ncbi:MAG: tRNA pseudouridine(55) synthase TruB [Myxococcales bacterium]|nr:tRNA pseudouridine(55) synthase TruB [Myxococcales bacterium]